MSQEQAYRSWRQVRAVYDNTTIRVYQAYRTDIADAALQAGRFASPPFKMGRMTWIKPSFLWMMYRAGWGLKDEGQARILAIDMCRRGFDWALANSCLIHAEPGRSEPEWKQQKAEAPVRIQWDPERNLALAPLPHRALQIGLGGEAVHRYVQEWTCRIEDVTADARRIHALVLAGDLEGAGRLLPPERPYPLAPELAHHIGAGDSA